MAALSQLKVSLLGGFTLLVDERPLTAVNQPQQQSLLAYLILQTPTPQLRRNIAFHFWPDLSEERAFANLRGALHKLRTDCPVIHDYLVSTNTTVYWQRTSSFHLDVYEYESYLAQARQASDPAQLRHRLEQAVAAYQGDLLPGCYDEWILPVRERLNQDYLQALQQLVDLLSQVGEYETAVTYAHQLRRSDPFQEQYYQRLMTLHEARGDRAAALRIYHECATMLEREWSVAPSPETQAIYGRLLNRSTPLAPIAPFPPSADKLIGRQAEWQTLQAIWHKACQGQPYFVLIQGEAGIGKTYLAEALLTWANQHNHLTVHTHAYAAEGQLTYSPVIEWLRSPAYANLLTSLEDVWLTECARLLPELLRPDLSAPPPVTASWQRQHLFEALARAVLAPRQPLLVLFDDLQWADRETLEWLRFLLRFDVSAALLLVGTVRMSDVTAEHPLTTLQQQLYRDGRFHEISLNPLTTAASDELAQKIAGSKLTMETLAELRRYAEGVPLFLVEAVRAEMEKEEAERWHWSTPTSLSTPTTLSLLPKVNAVIQARLNQLSPGARQLANIAAVIGRAFSLELLTLASHSDEESLVKNLDELWQRHIVREQGANYDLSHSRIRSVAYAEISPTQRRFLHRRVAEALTRRHAASLENVSAELAHHFEAAGLMLQAVDYYLQAGKAAQQIYANSRAYELLRQALTLVKQLPASTERDCHELSLSLALASTVRVVKGWTSSELYQIITQAWDLSHKIDDPIQRFRLIKALFSYHIVRGELDRAQPLSTQLLTISSQEQKPYFAVIAYNSLGSIRFHRGEYQSAQEMFVQSLALYNEQQHAEHILFDGADYGVLSSGWLSHSLWFLGYPDQALSQCQAAANLAQALAHPASQAMAFAYLGILYQLRRESEAVRNCADRCLRVAREHTLGYYREVAAILYTWSLAYPNPDPDKVMNFRAALNDFYAIGGGLRWNYYLSLLAELYERMGELSVSLETIDEAFDIVGSKGEHWWDAELYRLRGKLLHLQGANEREVEAVYLQALKVARDQKGRTLELRTAVSLAHLWQLQGRITEAYELLTPVYQQFGEGFATLDYQDARALLIDLKQ